jgi:hypothetical protein
MAKRCFSCTKYAFRGVRTVSEAVAPAAHFRPKKRDKRDENEEDIFCVLNIDPGHRMCRFIAKYNNWRKEILDI